MNLPSAELWPAAGTSTDWSDVRRRRANGGQIQHLGPPVTCMSSGRSPHTIVDSSRVGRTELGSMLSDNWPPRPASSPYSNSRILPT